MMRVLFLMVLMNTVNSAQYLVHVGDTPVTILQTQNGPGRSFVHLHQNETTALRAAQHVVAAHGGRVLTLIHPGDRNIVFHLNHIRYEFDPNRMFTDEGIKKTLTAWGHYSAKAHAAVRKLANRVKAMLPDGKIIAVHNNNDYSIKAYLPGKSLHHDADALHMNRQRYFRNFYLVTQPDDFLRLKKLQYNAILQSSEATDDGSLSVYLGRREYVNVEAGYGQLLAQIDMLKWV